MDLNNKVIHATKWSSITEFSAKLVGPISTMILARLLTPEAFGVLVTATMVISFAEIFTDAGFQKYLIQHEFTDKNSLFRATNVAFIANFCIACLICIILCIYSNSLASIVGNKGYGNVIAVSSLCLPLSSFSSIQMALYKRHFNFKTLFIVRMAGVFIPLLITIPLAYIFRSYWALIIGMIMQNLINSIILTIKSEWKPKIWFNWMEFKIMFSFTSLTMIESLTLWATSYIDIFIIGRMLDDYYLGLYKTSMSTVAQFITVITAIVTPVLFSTISRLQNNLAEFTNTFLKFQKVLAVLILPIGAILYIYKDLITEILLGSQWKQAAYFIGLWGVATAVSVVLSQICGEVYRAKGKPIISVIVQLTHIVCIIAAVLIAIPYGYHTLCIWRVLVRIQLVIANLIAVYYLVKIPPYVQLKNVLPSISTALALIVISVYIPISKDYMIALFQMLFTCILYILIISVFSKERNIIYNIINIIRRK